MAAEIDKTLFDAVIHNQIAQGRYADQQVRDILALMNRADKEILQKIANSKADTFTRWRLDALLAEVRRTTQDSYAEMQGALKEEMGAFAAHSAEVAGAMLATQMPVRWNPVGMTDTQLAAIIDTTPISIGPDKKLLLEEIFSKMAAGKEEDIRGALRLGMVQGETVDEMTRRLKGTKAAKYTDGILEGNRRDMAAIVRSVVVNTGNAATQAMYKENEEVVTGWIYVAVLDSKTCSVCWSESGKTFPLGSGPMPIRHVSCRCASVPALKTWKELGFDMEELQPGMRASSSGLVKSDISFQDWVGTQDKKTQVELLGPARQKLFANGGLKLDRFTDNSGQLYTLKELKAKNSSAFARAFN